MKKLTTQEFIEKAKEIHGDKYDYSKVEYKNNRTKICIICNTCGKEFWQTPNTHLDNHGCSYCFGTQKRTKEKFIQDAKQVHGNKYDYSKTKYINNKIKVCIICPEHGEFWQKPIDHIHGCNCPKCSKVYNYTTEEFVYKAKQVHGNKYDYSKTKYINSHGKICIICPKHGEFWQTANDHLQGKGCLHCNNSKGEEKIKNYLDEHNIKYVYDTSCLKCLEDLKPDFYLSDYNLVIEYDGEQHFIAKEIFGGEEGLKETQARDERKNRLCEENKIEILRIPYWDFDNIQTLLDKKLKID